VQTSFFYFYPTILGRSSAPPVSEAIYFRFAPDKQTSFTNILFNLFVNNVESLVESIFEFVEYNDNIEQ